MSDVLLTMEDLGVRFGAMRAVAGVSLSVRRGESVGIVGESGSGKSATMLAAMRLHPPGAAVTARRLELGGQDVRTLPEGPMRGLRGGFAAMIFQDPLTALNPLMAVGAQIAEVLARHRRLRGRAAHAEAVALLRQVGIQDAEARAQNYPHEFSGGMRQRVMIAAALAGNPALLIADEPTTALDVTVQAGITRLIRRLQAERGMGLVWVTHDLALMAGIVDRVVVMYAGRVMETAPVDTLYAAPRHPYTVALLASLPRLDGSAPASVAAMPGPAPASGCVFAPRCPARMPRCDTAAADAGCRAEPGGLLDAGRMSAIALCEAAGIGVQYRRAGRVFDAVSGVDFAVQAGETAAIVGESGCGKTTLGRALLMLQAPTAGTIRFRGEDLTRLTGRALRRRRRAMQMVFQDPYASLNPTMTIGETLAEPLVVHGLQSWRGARAPVADALAMVGLDPGMEARRPHAFSGGQRQRIAIARAVIARPDLVVADEPLSALDITVQGQILDLFARLRDDLGLTLVFISHDLPVVRRIAGRVAVMLGGRIVEQGPPAEVFARPAHPYTQALLDAVPIPDPAAERARQARQSGAAESSERIGRALAADACPFLARCPHAMAVCAGQMPPLAERAPGHAAACWLHGPRD